MTDEQLKAKAVEIKRLESRKLWRRPSSCTLSPADRKRLLTLCEYHDLNQAQLIRFLLLKEERDIAPARKEKS